MNKIEKFFICIMVFSIIMFFGFVYKIAQTEPSFMIRYNPKPFVIELDKVINYEEMVIRKTK